MAPQSAQGHEQLPLPMEEPEYLLKPVDLVERAEDLIPALDALAEMNSATGYRASLRSQQGWAELVRERGSERAAREEVEAAGKRITEKMNKAKDLFRIAAGYPRVDASHPLHQVIESELDEDFILFKYTYATSDRAADRRAAYKAKLRAYVAEHKQGPRRISSPLGHGLVQVTTDSGHDLIA